MSGLRMTRRWRRKGKTQKVHGKSGTLRRTFLPSVFFLGVVGTGWRGLRGVIDGVGSGYLMKMLPILA